MKRPPVNLEAILVSNYIQELAFTRKVTKYWGSETVNIKGQDVELFMARKQYYPKSVLEASGNYRVTNGVFPKSGSTKKLATFLDIYSSLTAKMQGVEKAWLYLDPNKDTKMLLKIDKAKLGAAFNSVFSTATKTAVGVNTFITLKVRLSDKGIAKFTTSPLPLGTPHSLTMSEEAKSAAINEILDRTDNSNSSYQALWDGGYYIVGDHKDPARNLLAIYALRPLAGINIYTPKLTTSLAKVEYSTGSETITTVTSKKVWALEFTINKEDFTQNTALLSMIEEDALDRSVARHGGKYQAALYLREMEDYEVASGGGRVQTFTKPYEAVSVYDPTANGYWVKYDGQWRLKTSYLTSHIDDPLLTPSSIGKAFAGMINSDYRKEDLSVWDYIVVTVIVVVAIILAIPSGGSSVKAGAVILATLFAVSTVAFYLTLAQLVLMASGAHGQASALASFLKTVDPLVKVADIVTAIIGIGKAITAAKEAAKKAAKEAVKNVTVEAIKAGTKEIAKASVKMMLGMGSGSWLSTQNMLAVAKFVFNMYTTKYNKEVSAELEKGRNELAAYQQMVEESQTSDLLKDITRSYTNQLAQDNSVYASLYDKPYEWWATPYHTGNMQATTVSALYFKST